MYQVGHYGVALLAYVPLGVWLATTGFERVAILGGLVCVALSTLPDCDEYLPFVEHRGPTHSVTFAVFVGAMLASATTFVLTTVSANPDPEVVAFAFTVGTLSILSHLAADVITPMGVRPFWPFSRRHYTANLTPAKNPVANYVLFGLGVVTAIAAALVVSVPG